MPKWMYNSDGTKKAKYKRPKLRMKKDVAMAEGEAIAIRRYAGSVAGRNAMKKRRGK